MVHNPRRTRPGEPDDAGQYHRARTSLGVPGLDGNRRLGRADGIAGECPVREVGGVAGVSVLDRDLDRGSSVSGVGVLPTRALAPWSEVGWRRDWRGGGGGGVGGGCWGGWGGAGLTRCG